MKGWLLRTESQQCLLAKWPRVQVPLFTAMQLFPEAVLDAPGCAFHPSKGLARLLLTFSALYSKRKAFLGREAGKRRLG